MSSNSLHQLSKLSFLLIGIGALRLSECLHLFFFMQQSQFRQRQFIQTFFRRLPKAMSSRVQKNVRGMLPSFSCQRPISYLVENLEASASEEREYIAEAVQSRKKVSKCPFTQHSWGPPSKFLHILKASMYIWTSSNLLSDWKRLGFWEKWSLWHAHGSTLRTESNLQLKIGIWNEARWLRFFASLKQGIGAWSICALSLR